MPRYYKRKIFDDYPDIKEEVNSELAAKVAELTDAEYNMAKQYYPGLKLSQIKRKIYESKCQYNDEQQQRG